MVVTVPASFDDVARNLTADAAKQAGLKHVTLLEEPQAAFYAWLGTHSPQEAGMLKPGMRCLVVDVGGGTSDFSLIRRRRGEGRTDVHPRRGRRSPAARRRQHGPRARQGGRDEAARRPARRGAVRLARAGVSRRRRKRCSPNPPPPTFPVTVMGKGRSVVGGTVSVNITPADVSASLFDGFFPTAPFDAEPDSWRAHRPAGDGPALRLRSGVSKHLAAFLRQHLIPASPSTAVDGPPAQQSMPSSSTAACSSQKCCASA